MISRKSLSALAAGLLLAGSGAALAHAHAKPHALKGAEFAGEAKVSLAKARAIALGVRPGRITDQELEKEGGGSGLRYSFDIKDQGKTFEVGVDAASGQVLENAAEGAHPD